MARKTIRLETFTVSMILPHMILPSSILYSIRGGAGSLRWACTI
jgi:hypothetical protein